MDLFVEMFMVRIISGDQRKPRPGNTSETGNDGKVRISHSTYAPHDWLARSWVKSEEYTSEGAFVVPA